MKRLTHLSAIRRTSRYRTFAVVAAVLAGLTVPLLGPGVASADPGNWEPFHFEGGPEVQENFCDVPGLTVENTFFVDGRFRTTARGDAGLPYYAEIAQSTDYWTNVATGEYVTFVLSYRFKDHNVTNNGDGTLTETVRTTTSGVLYSQDGRRLGHGAGLSFHFQLLIDHNGTPTDPSDDTVLAFLGGLKTAGRDFDFCAATVQAIG